MNTPHHDSWRSDTISETPSKRSDIKEMIRWWEKNRLIYNAFIIGFSGFLITEFWTYPMRGIKGGTQIILDGIIFTIVLNVFYTSSWLLGAVSHLLFKTTNLTNSGRWTIFVFGTLFALFLTNFYYVFVFDVLFAD